MFLVLYALTIYSSFRCLGLGHKPATCNVVREWNKLNEGGDEALNEKFLATISRPCPNCGLNIQKNGGWYFIVIVLTIVTI